jgi:hypothetical protein
VGHLTIYFEFQEVATPLNVKKNDELIMDIVHSLGGDKVFNCEDRVKISKDLSRQVEKEIELEEVTKACLDFPIPISIPETLKCMYIKYFVPLKILSLVHNGFRHRKS